MTLYEGHFPNLLSVMCLPMDYRVEMCSKRSLPMASNFPRHVFNDLELMTLRNSLSDFVLALCVSVYIHYVLADCFSGRRKVLRGRDGV